MAVNRHIDQRRHHHAAGRRDPGQRPARPGGELPLEHLALDLEPNQQEEQRHERIVDPVGDAERADFEVQPGKISLGQRRVGDEQRQSGRRHQHDATSGFAAEKTPQHRRRATPRRKLHVSPSYSRHPSRHRLCRGWRFVNGRGFLEKWGSCLDVRRRGGRLVLHRRLLFRRRLGAHHFKLDLGHQPGDAPQ